MRIRIQMHSIEAHIGVVYRKGCSNIRAQVLSYNSSVYDYRPIRYAVVADYPYRGSDYFKITGDRRLKNYLSAKLIRVGYRASNGAVIIAEIKDVSVAVDHLRAPAAGSNHQPSAVREEHRSAVVVHLWVKAVDYACYVGNTRTVRAVPNQSSVSIYRVVIARIGPRIGRAVSQVVPHRDFRAVWKNNPQFGQSVLESRSFTDPQTGQRVYVDLLYFYCRRLTNRPAASKRYQIRLGQIAVIEYGCIVLYLGWGPSRRRQIFGLVISRPKLAVIGQRNGIRGRASTADTHQWNVEIKVAVGEIDGLNLVLRICRQSRLAALGLGRGSPIIRVLCEANTAARTDFQHKRYQ